MDGTEETVAAAGNGMEAAMAAGSGSCTVVEIDIDDTEVAPRIRSSPSIYRVPKHIKNTTNPDVYQPRLVSLGPFHHGKDELQHMEKHKHRAVAHLVERSGKPLREFMAAVEETAEQLRAAYEDLGEEWSGERFVKLMVTDGCFLLEVMRAFQFQREGKKVEGGDYEPDDPVFSEHGYLYLRGDIISDVLVMENQVPLLLLDTLWHVAYADNLQQQKKCLRINDDSVLSFLFSSPVDDAPAINGPLGLHPVDVVQRDIRGARQDRERSTGGVFLIPCAVELQEAGIRFEVAADDDDAGGGFAGAVRFKSGVLSIRVLHVMDSTESMFLNLMAFERMHPGAGNDAMAVVIFMDNIIDTAKDVALLKSRGIISNLLGSDEAVATLFNDLSKGAVMSPYSSLYGVQEQVNAHCKKRRNRWRASLMHNYFRNPWVFISLVAAFILLAATVMQTIYAVISFYSKSTEAKLAVGSTEARKFN